MIDIQKAISDADNLKSKITEEAMSQFEGLSSPRVRHLLNNLASQAKSYLEVGVYLGGTLRAAMYGNSLYVAAVDNFSMDPGARDKFKENTKGLEFDFFDEDSFSMDITKIKKPIEVLFFDGNHSVESQYKAVHYYLPILADEYVFVVDDWDMNKVRVGTHTALRDYKLKVLEKHELKGASGASLEARQASWWGGLGCFKIKKP